MGFKRPTSRLSSPRRSRPSGPPLRLRIVAGEKRGHKIEYHQDPELRPMKERTREAVFSMLGGYLYDSLALDLFSGTGILGFEAVSRGCVQGILLELSRSSIGDILRNAEKLRILDRIEVHNVDTLRWVRGGALERLRTDMPWVVFVCPPYRMWHEQSGAMCELVRQLYEIAPPESQIVCEADLRYDFAASMPELPWDVRRYPPAWVGRLRKTSVEGEQQSKQEEESKKATPGT